MELVHFETLDQFSSSSFKICEFSPFNLILLGLFDVLYVLWNCIWVVYTIWHIFTLILSQIIMKHAWNVKKILQNLIKMIKSIYFERLRTKLIKSFEID